MATRAEGAVNLNQIQLEWGAWLDDQKATAPQPRRASLPSTSSNTAPKLTAKVSSYRTTLRSSWPKHTICPCRPISMSSRRRCCRWQCDLQTEESPACLAAYRGVPNLALAECLTLNSHINMSAFVVPILPVQRNDSRDLHLCHQGVSCPCFSLNYSYTQLCKYFDSVLRERHPDAHTPGEITGDAIIQTPQRRHRFGPVPSIQSGRDPRWFDHRSPNARFHRCIPARSRGAQDIRRESAGDSGQVGQKNVRMERELHPD